MKIIGTTEVGEGYRKEKAFVAIISMDELQKVADKSRYGAERDSFPVPKVGDDYPIAEGYDFRISAQVHRADEIKRLTQQIKNAETQCGSCTHWMTRQCPREQHSNKTGRSTGPSSQSLKCEKFAMPQWQAKELDAAKAKLLSLTTGATP